MKRKTQHLCSLIFMALLASSFQVQAQQHVIKETFDAASEVNIRHRRGPLNVAPSEDGKIHFEAEISFDAKDKAEAQKLIKAFSVKAGKVGDRIDIDSNLGIKNFTVIGNRSTMVMGDGTKIKGIRNLKVYLTVKVPDVKRLKVDNRYNEINVFVDVKNQLRVDAYSAELRIGNISGDLAMSAKYSNGTVRDFKDGDIELYESKINFGNAQNVAMNTKYSQIELGSMESFKTESYENKFKLGDIRNSVEVNDKYSTFYFSNLGDANFSLYETEMKGGLAKDMKISSKYTDLEWTAAGAISFTSSYEDALTVGKARSLGAMESKYSKFKFSTLEESLEINSYEDDIWISATGTKMDLIKIKGKYTTLDCPLSSTMPFKIDMKAKYTSIDLTAEDLDFTKFVEKGDNKEISGSRNKASDQSLKIAIDCYDCKIKLKG